MPLECRENHELLVETVETTALPVEEAANRQPDNAPYTYYHSPISFT